MTLSINSPTNTIITIVDTLLNDFIAAPASYTDIDIQIYFNSTTSSTTETYTDADPITTSTNIASNSGVETVNPAFFGGTSFEQGIYHFIITLTSESEIETSEGCLYVEDGLKCDVDEYILNSSVDILERVLAGIKYQSLISATECPCKCDKKIKIYNNLIDINNTCQGC
jgi:hypothetical protein